MKIKLLTAVFILLQLHLFAQEKFIEVTVTDTAWVKPDNFVYNISISSINEDEYADTSISPNPGVYKQRILERQKRNKKLFDSVSQVIKESGFHILPDMLNNSFKLMDENRFKVYSINVLTGSVDSLKILYNVVSKNSAFSYAYVEAAFAKNEKPFYQNLYSRLIAQATAKANMLAGLSGRKLDRIISITQSDAQKDKPGGGWTIYPPLSDYAEPGWHTTVQTQNNFKISNDEIVTDYMLQNTLIVRFAIE